MASLSLGVSRLSLGSSFNGDAAALQQRRMQVRLIAFLKREGAAAVSV